MFTRGHSRSLAVIQNSLATHSRSLAITHASSAIAHDSFVIIRGSRATHSAPPAIQSQLTQDRVLCTHGHPQPLTITGDHSGFLHDHPQSLATHPGLCVQTCSPRPRNVRPSRIENRKAHEPTSIEACKGQTRNRNPAGPAAQWIRRWPSELSIAGPSLARVALVSGACLWGTRNAACNWCRLKLAGKGSKHPCPSGGVTRLRALMIAEPMLIIDARAGGPAAVTRGDGGGGDG